jgi:hypothetical protein
VLADRAEALDHDSRTGELQLDMVPRYIDCADKTKTGGADLVERDATDLARQPDGAADLVLDSSPLPARPFPCPDPGCTR